MSELVLRNNDDLGDFNKKNSVCYGLRVKEHKVVFTKDNKAIAEISKECFPSDIDFNNVESIGKILFVVRTKGLDSYLNSINIGVPE